MSVAVFTSIFKAHEYLMSDTCDPVASYGSIILILCGLHSHLMRSPFAPYAVPFSSHVLTHSSLWVNAYRENGRQQNKFSWSTLRANREHERPHNVKTAADMYAYRETADALHGRPAAFKEGLYSTIRG